MKTISIIITALIISINISAAPKKTLKRLTISKEKIEYRKIHISEEGSSSISKSTLTNICTIAGYTIYKRRGISNANLRLNDLFVFNGDELELQLNKENYQYVLSFFFPAFNKIYMS